MPAHPTNVTAQRLTNDEFFRGVRVSMRAYVVLPLLEELSGAGFSGGVRGCAAMVKVVCLSWVKAFSEGLNPVLFSPEIWEIKARAMKTKVRGENF